MEDWLRNIASYIIFSTFFLMLLPSKKYEKYIRVFLGMLFLFIVIKPIMSFFDFDQNLWWNYEKQLYLVQSDHYDEAEVDKRLTMLTLGDFQKFMENDIKDFLLEAGINDIHKVQVLIKKDDNTFNIAEIVLTRHPSELITPPAVLKNDTNLLALSGYDQMIKELLYLRYSLDQTTIIVIQ